MFGRNIGSRIGVSEGDFGRFVDREIMSRFPNGLTVFNAAGQWRDEASNKIAREPSKVVQIVLPGQVDDIARLNEIVEAYKRRFKQHSVVMIVRPALRVVLVPARLPRRNRSLPGLRCRRTLPNYLHNVGSIDGGSASWSR